MLPSFKGTLPKNITYEDLRQMYVGNRDLLAGSTYKLYSTVAEFQTLEALFGQEQADVRNSTESFHLDW